MQMALTKRTLGHGYIVSAGVTLSLVLLAHAAVSLETDPVVAFVALAGVAPALSLAGAAHWLPENTLEGDHIWTIAQWSGLGIAVLTLLNVGVLTTVRSLSPLTPVLLAVGVAVGGATGVVVGALLELRRSARRLAQANGVLGRVIQHNLRNDLTVVLGHLSELEHDVSDEQAASVDRLATKVDDIVSTAEKARQIDVALAGTKEETQPVDLVTPLQRRLEAVERSYPKATIETDIPDEAYVVGGWLLKTAIDNVVENVLAHSDGPPDVRVVVRRDGGSVRVRFVDSGPPIPENERVVFTAARETLLDHSTGVGLWLVRLVMESYGGDVGHEYNDGGGNTIELRFQAATAGHGRSLLDRLQSVF